MQIIKANFDASSFILNDTELKKGFKKFATELNKQKPGLLQNNFLYINNWSIICKPCLDEIPLHNELSVKLGNDISYCMVTHHSEEAVNKLVIKENIELKKFIFVNGMINFISGIYNEIKIVNLSFPLHIVLDSKGNVLAYLFGAFQDENSYKPIINFINKLKQTIETTYITKTKNYDNV
jgi:hypothetical protein